MLFFYTSLFVASLLVVVIYLWLYNLILDISSEGFRAIFSSLKDGAPDHHEGHMLTAGMGSHASSNTWKGRAASSNVSRNTKLRRELDTTIGKPWGW